MEEHTITNPIFVDVTWTRAMKVWWSIIWRSTLLTLLGSMLFGVIFSVLGGILNIDTGTGVIYSSLGGFVIGMLSGIYAVKKILSKNFSDFKVALISKNNN